MLNRVRDAGAGGGAADALDLAGKEVLERGRFFRQRRLRLLQFLGCQRYFGEGGQRVDDGFARGGCGHVVEVVQRNGQHAAQEQDFFAQQVALHRQRAVGHAGVHQGVFDFDGLMRVAQQDAALVQRLAGLLPLQDGLDDLRAAVARCVGVGGFVNLGAQRQVGIHRLLLEGFHRVGQMRAVAVGHRQREVRAIGEAGADAALKEGFVGAQVGIDHLVFVAHAHEVGDVHVQQRFDDAERCFVDVVQLVDQD
ncbi:hypothetical protein D3C85_544690 [compost metagenome]